MSTVLVGEIATQVRGVSYKKPELSDGPAPGYLPVLRANNITDDGLIFDDLVHVDENRVSPKQRIQPGDIVIAASSGSLSVVGKAAQATKGFEGSFGAFCKVVRPGAAVHASFLGHYFRTPGYRRKISRLAAGANINNLKNSHLDELEIWLPPLPEQQRIATILDQADALRRLRRQSIARLSGLGQAIFFDMFGDPAQNPKGWPMGTIRDLLAEAKYGTAKKANSDGKGLPILRMGNLTYEGQIDLSDLKHVELSDNEIPKYTTRPGDLLFNRTNSKDLVGKTAVVDQSEPMAIAGYLVRARTNELGNPFYVSAFLNSIRGKSILRNMCKNIVGMANINAQELQNIPIALPPIELQDEFADKIATITKRRDEVDVALDASNRLFSSLQHRAFRGEL